MSYKPNYKGLEVPLLCLSGMDCKNVYCKNTHINICMASIYDLCNARMCERVHVSSIDICKSSGNIYKIFRSRDNFVFAIEMVNVILV